MSGNYTGNPLLDPAMLIHSSAFGDDPHVGYLISSIFPLIDVKTNHAIVHILLAILSVLTVMNFPTIYFIILASRYPLAFTGVELIDASCSFTICCLCWPVYIGSIVTRYKMINLRGRI